MISLCTFTLQNQNKKPTDQYIHSVDQKLKLIKKIVFLQSYP